jgi:hypothetical protein
LGFVSFVCTARLKARKNKLLLGIAGHKIFLSNTCIMLRFFEYRNTYFFVFLGVSDAEFFFLFSSQDCLSEVNSS